MTAYPLPQFNYSNFDITIYSQIPTQNTLFYTMEIALYNCTSFSHQIVPPGNHPNPQPPSTTPMHLLNTLILMLYCIVIYYKKYLNNEAVKLTLRDVPPVQLHEEFHQSKGIKYTLTQVVLKLFDIARIVFIKCQTLFHNPNDVNCAI